ncbi:DUF5681 domain-containing protein [Bradyrhizobium sp.]|uniref:DUF5681 domain-containing protein n=1 Tax=Bradyrhizobium sp. TaxID=376 RepID=UPI00273697B2|nr:DUF5681 domain-containing protein [Bradyrhizobium sp.]MDP3078676.1 DUF5681 domain-containing protein [Bradyrhizobium sp.]
MTFKKGETPKGAKPFTKGKSGNPDGRPPGSRSLRTILKEAIEIKRKSRTDPLNPDAAPRDMTIGEELVAKWVSLGLDGSERSLERMFEQLEGKAVQPISGPEGGPVQTETVFKLDEASNEMVKAIGQTLAKVKVG